MKKFLLLAALFGASISSHAQFAGGTGTADDPYQVATAEQLQAIKDYTSSHFIQTEDIDLDGVVWSPIGTFTGQYNGNGKEIQNLVIESGSDGLGLFSKVNTPGVIENVVMRGCYLVAGNWSGILCGTNGNWEVAGGLFKNCYIYDSEIDGGDMVGAFAGVAGGSFEGCHAYNVNVTGTGTVGGISADNEAGGHYWNCTFYGNVEGGGTTGGIIGFMNGNPTVENGVENCVVYGTVSVGGAKGTVGGIIGAPNWNVSASNIINCASFADVSGPCAGGIGGNSVRGKVERAYATGKITATCLYDNGWGDPWNGGICAVNFNGPVSDTYFSGTMEALEEGIKLGGVMGRYWDGVSVTNSYYNSEGAPLACGDGGQYWVEEGQISTLLVEDMVKMENFKFSDMSKWQIVEGVTTPFFANQTAPVTITECTTAKIAGTGDADLENVYLLGSFAGSLPGKVKVENGNWSIELPADQVIENEWITAIGIGKDKMPSMVTKMQVSISDGIHNATTEGAKTVEGIYDVTGRQVSSAQAGKVCIVKYSDGTAKKIVK